MITSDGSWITHLHLRSIWMNIHSCNHLYNFHDSSSYSYEFKWSSVGGEWKMSNSHWQQQQTQLIPYRLSRFNCIVHVAASLVVNAAGSALAQIMTLLSLQKFVSQMGSPKIHVAPRTSHEHVGLWSHKRNRSGSSQSSRGSCPRKAQVAAAQILPMALCETLLTPNHQTNGF